MSWQTLALRPLDGLFFRDARPFNQDDEGLAEARTLFPPFPTQLAGAVRAAMARAAGWDGTRARPGASGKDDPWHAFRGTFGDGLDDAGELRFGPPLLLLPSALRKNWEVLYPLPNAVLCRAPTAEELKKRGRDKPYAVHEVVIAKPGSAGAACDAPLGSGMSLPVVGPKGFDQRPDCWISRESMTTFLKGRAVDPKGDAIVSLDEVAPSELRIGLERNSRTHRATTGMLYTAAHRRLKPDHALGIAVDWTDGRAEPVPALAEVMPLGGHGRAVAVEAAAADVHVQQRLLPWSVTPPSDTFGAGPDHSLNVMVVLISPCSLSPERMAGALGADLVSACVGRPLIFGGWNVGKRAPIRRFLPAGTTLFLRKAGERSAVLAELRKRQEEGLGAYAWFGCGAFVIGTWKNGEGAGNG
mgnify:CR=1 FL=1